MESMSNIMELVHPTSDEIPCFSLLAYNLVWMDYCHGDLRHRNDVCLEYEIPKQSVMLTALKCKYMYYKEQLRNT